MSSNEAFISTISTRVFHPTGGNRYANQRDDDSWEGLVDSPIYTGEIAMCINWLADTEPSKMGRTFFPAVPTLFVEGGRWSGDALTAANNLIGIVVAGLEFDGTTFYPCIWRESDETYRQITGGYLSPNVGQMSKRGMGE